MIAAGQGHATPDAAWRAMVAAFDPGNAIGGGDVIDTLRSMRARLSPTGCDLTPDMIDTLPAKGRAWRNPDFWGDMDVRRLAVELHRQVPVHRALALIERQVGPERTPSKSALSRAWQRIDILKNQQRSR